MRDLRDPARKAANCSSSVGGGGCKRTPKRFYLSKMWAKSLKIWAKPLKIWVKLGKVWENLGKNSSHPQKFACSYTYELLD